MESAGEEDIEYESDSEEEKLLLGTRRREASSDDEVGESDLKPRAPIHSDSDEPGWAVDYDYEDEELEVYEEEKENGTDGFVNRGIDVKEEVDKRLAEDGSVANKMDDNLGDGEEGEKEIEPFAVPTAGAFYMHDDRFRDNAAVRNRRTFGGRKLWESRDDKKWGHDKFEEMNSHERPYEQGRRGSKGQYQGRGGKNHGPDHRYPKRNKAKSFINDNNPNQPPPPKGIRGRGPRKYENRWKRSEHKLPEKSFDRTTHGSSGRVYAPESKTNSDQVRTARKNSSLNSASPPFYPSGASSKDSNLPHKRDIQSESTKWKAIADSVGIDRLCIDDSVNRKMPSSGPLLADTMQASRSRTQGRGISVNSHEPTDVETSSESGKSRGVLAGKGKGGVQGSGRGSFAYSGAPAMGAAGNMAVNHDQNFPGTPAFLPVMQFGGQHSGGLGVPAVGMAFPGFVAQPQLGLGNSEMTWYSFLFSQSVL